MLAKWLTRPINYRTETRLLSWKKGVCGFCKQSMLWRWGLKNYIHQELLLFSWLCDAYCTYIKHSFKSKFQKQKHVIQHSCNFNYCKAKPADRWNVHIEYYTEHICLLMTFNCQIVKFWDCVTCQPFFVLHCALNLVIAFCVTSSHFGFRRQTPSTQV